MDKRFFKANRQRAAKSLGIQPIILAANGLMQKRSDMHFEFWQESNFWWLTGIEEAGWELIIADGKEWLVARESSQVDQIFNGSLSIDYIKKVSGIDNIINKRQAAELVDGLAKKYDLVWLLGRDPHSKYFDFYQNPAQSNLSRRLKKVFRKTKDCRADLAKLRAIKQPTEIEAIERAVNLTAETFSLIKKQLPSYTYEFQIEADFTHFFRREGASGHAYDPIIAAGGNACTLHYSRNDSSIKPDQLILMDVGARVNGYSADITRTYSVGGASKRQRQLHQAVNDAHRQIIDLLKPGLSTKDYISQSDDTMRRTLNSLGLLSGKDDYRKYFPHAISHGLGVDVHDSLGGFDEFREGMVITVEPGVYIPEESIGIRIEDDILITAKGNRNLSEALSTNLL